MNMFIHSELRLKQVPVFTPRNQKLSTFSIFWDMTIIFIFAQISFSLKVTAHMLKMVNARNIY